VEDDNDITNDIFKDLIPIILAGGSSRRFDGDKLFYRIAEKPLIKYTCENVEKIFGREPVIIASKTNAEKLSRAKISSKIHVDNLLGGPITGILKALELYDQIMVFGGDMPCVRMELVSEILNTALQGFSIVLPGWRNGFLEPLHGYYSRGAESYLRKLYLRGIRSLSQAVRLVPGAKILLIDDYPDLVKLSLYNINNRDDVRCFEDGVLAGEPDPCLRCVQWIKTCYR